MNDKHYKTKRAVLARAEQVIGIPLKDIDKTDRLKTGKGAIGSVLEESWFGYKINSESAPDFADAGVELKATPYRKTRKGIRAKERLVCNIIDYMSEHDKTFETSSFWKKCNTMLIMAYEHIDNEAKENFTISNVFLFSFPEQDLEVIKHDWLKIVEKIQAGRAHEISESDTLYLGACTKGASSKNTRNQPFSAIPAMQRAYSLKSSYMTYILNNYIFGSATDENIIKDSAELADIGFEQYITNRIKPYVGLSQETLKQQFGIKTKAKHVNELLLAKMLGIDGKIAHTQEFRKANIIPKTIRVQKSGSIKESMSFPTINFIDIVQETWDESTFKNYLTQTKFLFIIFQFNENNELIFRNLVFWNIPETDLFEVETVWRETVRRLQTGEALILDGKKQIVNLPKQKENPVCHVRPHGMNSDDKSPLPDGRNMTKQSFWLRNKYIRAQIEKIQGNGILR